MRLAVFRLRRKTALSFAYGKTHAFLQLIYRNLSDGVAAAEVGFYPAFSPLPSVFRRAGKRQAVYFLWRCLSPFPGPGRYPASCPAEPGLSSLNSRVGEPKAAAWFIAGSLYAKHAKKAINLCHTRDNHRNPKEKGSSRQSRPPRCVTDRAGF